MKKTTAFILGAVATAIPAALAFHFRSKREIEELIIERRRLQQQLQAQRRLLNDALTLLEEQKAKA